MKRFLLLIVTTLQFLYAQILPLVGPDAPQITGSINGGNVYIELENLPASNNYLEQYMEWAANPGDLSAGYTDSIIDFEGYLIYQVTNPNVTLQDIGDTSLCRLVYQCDIMNPVNTLEAVLQDGAGNCFTLNAPTANAGIPDSIMLTTDYFTGSSFSESASYYFMAVAYGHNEFLQNQDCNTPSPNLLGSRIQILTTGILSVETIGLDHLQVYPNPAIEVINVSLDEGGPVEIIEILGITGSTAIPQGNYSSGMSGGSAQVPVYNLAPGVYIIQVYTPGRVYRTTFVKR